MTEIEMSTAYHADGRKPPCFDRATMTDCPDRSPECALTCERWAAYTAARNERYEKQLENAKMWRMYAEHVEKAMEKCKRRKP